MNTSAEPQLALVPLTAENDYREANELYRSVFGLDGPAYAINPRLMSALRRSGGSVIGARDPSGALIGFAYGFTGTGAEGPFHYSQSVVVAPEHQHRGLGRRLKEAQRALALEAGVTVMRWAFDPLLARNAHFNLDVLGGRARWYSGDYYDTQATEPGGGTSRLVVEWDLLRAGRRPALTVPAELGTGADAWGHPLRIAGQAERVWLPLPAAPPAEDRFARPLRSRLDAQLESFFAAGLTAVSCTRYTDADAAYLLIPDGEEP
ncbi:GNAT family N-acetyltransferase [Gryllotalpicola koreensis]|uniref:N-acetyltransferase domain-containing protein n=1 Tax=Gryllotalpicola koreensis TaxID=993086 RepID=A0ABP7ZTT7_9MICO